MIKLCYRSVMPALNQRTGLPKDEGEDHANFSSCMWLFRHVCVSNVSITQYRDAYGKMAQLSNFMDYLPSSSIFHKRACVGSRAVGENGWMEDLTCARARPCNVADVLFSIFRMWKNMLHPFHAHRLNKKLLYCMPLMHAMLITLLRRFIVAWWQDFPTPSDHGPEIWCRMCKFIWTTERDNAKMIDAQCATIHLLSQFTRVTQAPTFCVNDADIIIPCYPTDVE